MEFNYEKVLILQRVSHQDVPKKELWENDPMQDIVSSELFLRHPLSAQWFQNNDIPTALDVVSGRGFSTSIKTYYSV